MDTLLGGLHAVAWAVYVGGAITMEWVLRYAQKEMPGPQVGVVCKNAGMRYRWLALGCLVVIGITGGWMLLRLDEADLLGRPGAHGATSLALTVAFLAVVRRPGAARAADSEAVRPSLRSCLNSRYRPPATLLASVPAAGARPLGRHSPEPTE